MKRHIKRGFYFTIGAISFLLGLLGVLLPLLPTTPFMILAAACFSQSSPRFHQALLNNRWIGKELRQWEETKTMKRSTKKRSTILIVITFAISIGLLWQRPELQLMLAGIAAILLFFIWRINEHSEPVEIEIDSSTDSHK